MKKRDVVTESLPVPAERKLSKDAQEFLNNVEQLGDKGRAELKAFMQNLLEAQALKSRVTQ
jgi:hypothetical protein